MRRRAGPSPRRAPRAGALVGLFRQGGRRLLLTLLGAAAASGVATAQDVFSGGDVTPPAGGVTGTQGGGGNPLCPPPVVIENGKRVTPRNWSCDSSHWSASRLPPDDPSARFGPRPPQVNGGLTLQQHIDYGNAVAADRCRRVKSQQGNLNGFSSCQRFETDQSAATAHRLDRIYDRMNQSPGQRQRQAIADAMGRRIPRFEAPIPRAGSRNFTQSYAPRGGGNLTRSSSAIQSVAHSSHRTTRQANRATLAGVHGGRANPSRSGGQVATYAHYPLKP